MSSDASNKEQRRQERRQELREQLAGHLETSLLMRLRSVEDAEDMKLFPTSQELIDPRKAKKMPLLNVQSLAGGMLTVPKAGMSTLLLVGFNKTGMEQMSSWREVVERHEPLAVLGGGRARLQVVELAVSERAAYQWLAPMLRFMLQRSVPEEKRASVAAIYEPMPAYKKALGIANDIVGHAFLVDPAGLVRWRACGSADFEESIALLDCVSALLEEGAEAE